MMDSFDNSLIGPNQTEKWNLTGKGAKYSQEAPLLNIMTHIHWILNESLGSILAYHVGTNHRKEPQRHLGSAPLELQ